MAMGEKFFVKSRSADEFCIDGEDYNLLVSYLYKVRKDYGDVNDDELIEELDYTIELLKKAEEDVRFKGFSLCFKSREMRESTLPYTTGGGDKEKSIGGDQWEINMLSQTIDDMWDISETNPKRSKRLQAINDKIKNSGVIGKNDPYCAIFLRRTIIERDDDY